MTRALATLILVVVGVVSAVPTRAGELTVRVRDRSGAPISKAIVALEQPASHEFASTVEEEAIIDQVSRRFVPDVSSVRVGTRVSFPNSDDVRHHVYSFSRAKPFQIKLYHGTPTDPIIFDKPGLVVLGCNIHDRMVGYLYVAGSPHHAVLDKSGEVHFKGVQPGPYELYVWHPAIPVEERHTQLLTVTDQATQTTVVLNSTVVKKRAPETIDDVERQFRELRGASS